MEEISRRWSEPLRYIVLVALVLGGIGTLILLKDNMMLLVVSVIIAFLLMPLIGFCERRLHLPRKISVLIAYLVGILILVISSTLLVPSLIQRVSDFINQDWPSVFNSIDTWLADLIRELEVNQLTIGSMKLDLSVSLVETRRWLNSIDPSSLDLTKILAEWTTILSSAFSIGKNVFSTLLSFITSIFVSIHVANDGGKLSGEIVRLFKKEYRPEINELLTRLSHVWTKFFAGEVKLMLVIGIMTTVFCYALGLRWAIPLGIIAGCLEVIPNIGPILSTVPAVISTAIFGSSYLPFNHFIMVILTVLTYVLIQQLENAIVVPRVMSDALGVHPVILIIGILVLSGRMGVLGALFAAPLLGMAKVLLHYFFCKLREEDPYPFLYEEPEEAARKAA